MRGLARILNHPSPRNIEAIDNFSLPMQIRMMQQGVCVDRDRLSDLSRYLESECAQATYHVEELTGKRINPGSHDQVRELLFRDLQVHKTFLMQMADGEVASGERKRELKLRITPTGLVSTAKLEIERFLGCHPVVAEILWYRQCDKLKGTYAEGLMRHAVRQADGTYRVFFTLKPCATDTGRLASEEPNLQNIPIRTEAGRRIKACFLPSIGCRLFEVDFSQIEMRMAAHLSGCQNMMEAFHARKDIHVQTAVRVFGLPEPEIEEMTHRYPMKRTGFGVLYLITGKGLAYQLNAKESQDPLRPHVWTEEECDRLIEDWYNVNPEVRDFHEETFARARRFGMVWTMFGRIRCVPEVLSCHSWIREKGLRQAANQPVQGGAADLFRMALGELHRRYAEVRDSGLRCEGLIPVHDSVIGEADEGIADEVARMTKEAMENLVELRVPVVADAKVGRTPETSWRDLEKMKEAA